jgi:hypothetical protein
MSTKSSKNGAYDMLVAQKDTITKITGIITPESIDTLKNELGGAFTILKSTHFNEGQRYGFLPMVGAVLIKSTLAIVRTKKTLHVFFLSVSYLRSTLTNPYSK